MPVDSSALSRQAIADLAASFQRVVVDSLLDRTFEAAGWLGARSIGFPAISMGIYGYPPHPAARIALATKHPGGIAAHIGGGMR